MPFYKWVIEAPKYPRVNSADDRKWQEYLDLNGTKRDATDVANGGIVNAMRQLSQLVQIADDIFTSLDDECRSIFNRAKRIGIKINHCQEIVDGLNAKSIPVPLGTLSGPQQETAVHYASCHAQDGSLLSPASRPPALDRLRDSTDGPLSPVSVPPHQVADGRPGSSTSSSVTHIYCRPIDLDSCSSSQSSAETLPERSMTSVVEIPSTVVPIDVSGQPFSRMSSFRRSLIHVDFLIRRKKKKDKRRNTVSEGDSKELKEVLQKVAIESQLPNVPNSDKTLEKTIINNHKLVTKPPDIDHSLAEETNNNFIKRSPVKLPQQNGAIHNNITSNRFSEQNGDSLKLREKQNFEVTSNGSIINRKKKPRSHLPISTSSAAMTVAVKMRQTHNNGVRHEDGQSSSGNWSCSSERTSSDSDQQKSGFMNGRNGRQSSLSNSDDSLLTDNSMTKKSQSRFSSFTSTSESIEKKIITDVSKNRDDTDLSTCGSSDYRKNSIADSTSTTASFETDAIFISSEESDDELSDLSFFQETFGSSTSLSTISNGSLNSLLSRTGTEMSSSTGTLTSICQEPLPTPPPPPPKAFAVVLPKEDSGSVSSTQSQKKSSKQRLPKSPLKMSSKSSKSPSKDSHKSEQGASKNIFVNLVSKKAQQKANSIEMVKLKEMMKPKKTSKVDTPVQFDMYGNWSPMKSKQLPVFTKENVSPIIEKSPRHHLQSFCPDDGSTRAKQETDIFVKNAQSTIMKQASAEINDPIAQIKVSPVCNHAESATSDTFSDVIEMPISEELAVPLKYGHQITVTPVRRHASIENYSNSVCRRSYMHTPKHSLPLKSEAICDTTINIKSPNSTKTVEVEHPTRSTSANLSGYSTFHPDRRPQRPATLIPPNATKPAARVVLDPEGRVVYSTNSLDRRRYNHIQPVNVPHYPDKQQNFHSNHLAFAEVHQNPYRANYDISQHTTPSPPNMPQTNTTVNCQSGQQTYNDSHFGQQKYNYSHDQYHANDHQCTTSPVVTEFYPSHKILPSRENSVKIVYPLEDVQSHMGNHNEVANGKYHFIPVKSSPPDPNISGLPQTPSMLTQQNVSLHSQHLDRLNTPQNEKSMRSSSSECSYLLTPPPQLYSHNNRALRGDLQALKQSSMSTEDLFAVIHSGKKRLNIKTDSDHSLASSSSRSSSPSYARQSQSKGCLAETGFLSPRSSYAPCDNPRDRRSWADFRSPPGGSGGDRRSLASDRLGPTKPTSMHDFKMLLLQTRTSSQTNSSRKSAAELLKVPVSRDNVLGINSSPLSLSPRNSISFTTQNSPTSEAYLCSGHSTVPFKRGNRARASLQPRYMMYPPIFEDCSEETENSREVNAEEWNRSKQVKSDGNYNPRLKSGMGASSMWV